MCEARLPARLPPPADQLPLRRGGTMRARSACSSLKRMQAFPCQPDRVGVACSQRCVWEEVGSLHLLPRSALVCSASSQHWICGTRRSLPDCLSWQLPA